MTTHARTQIRHALVAALTGLASTGANVSSDRFHLFEAAHLPGLRVYADSETKVGEQMKSRQQRQVLFVVEAVAAQDATLEDTLDQVALEVEAAIAADMTLGGLAKGGCLYAGIDAFQEDVSADLPVGIWPIKFTADYDVDAAHPEIIT